MIPVEFSNSTCDPEADIAGLSNARFIPPEASCTTDLPIGAKPF
jgi:hypothetical protein